MKKKNMTAKIAAIVALIAILWSVVWTGVLVVYESFFASNNSETSLTPEQLQDLINSYSLWEENELSPENNLWDDDENSQEDELLEESTQ